MFRPATIDGVYNTAAALVPVGLKVTRQFPNSYNSRKFLIMIRKKRTGPGGRHVIIVC